MRSAATLGFGHTPAQIAEQRLVVALVELAEGVAIAGATGLQKLAIGLIHRTHQCFEDEQSHAGVTKI